VMTTVDDDDTNNYQNWVIKYRLTCLICICRRCQIMNSNNHHRVNIINHHRYFQQLMQHRQM
jgi:hypothetical protein